MSIQYFTPSPPLKPYIRSYYVMRAELGHHRVEDVFYADGCPEIVFNTGVDFYRDHEKEPWAKVIGQILSPLKIQAKGNGISFGVWFQPHGFTLLSNIPQAQLQDQAVAASEFLRPDFLHVMGDLLANEAFGKVVSSLDQYFEQLLRLRTRQQQWQLAQFATTALLYSHFDLPLNTLAEKSNVSPRYLQKVFHDIVGLRPKQLQRIGRFQKALTHLAKSKDHSSTATAYHAGYFDQSHFIREFKAFTGQTPTHTNINLQPLSKYFLR